VLAAVPQVSVTFHRAFDSLHDPLPAIDALLTVPQIDRLLTSGGEGTAARRGDRLREYVERARGRLTIIAGGGVDEDGLVHFARTGCVTEVHVGRAAREGGDPEAAVSVERVRRLKALIAGEDA
jgi:copper homeostasis protein